MRHRLHMRSPVIGQRFVPVFYAELLIFSLQLVPSAEYEASMNEEFSLSVIFVKCLKTPGWKWFYNFIVLTEGICPAEKWRNKTTRAESQTPIKVMNVITEPVIAKHINKTSHQTVKTWIMRWMRPSFSSSRDAAAARLLVFVRCFILVLIHFTEENCFDFFDKIIFIVRKII